MTKRHKQIEKVNKIGDLGTPERHQRGEVSKELIDGKLIATVRRATSFHPMYRRGIIDLVQFSAAQKLRNDHDIGVIGYHSCEYREPVDGGKDIEKTERELHHRKCFYLALDALYSVESKLLVHVVINDNSVASRALKSTDNRKRMTKFKQTLDKLAKYYGFC